VRSDYDRPVDGWTPGRATIATVANIAIGLSLFDLTEYLRVRRVGADRYVRVTDLPQVRRYAPQSPDETDSSKDMPTGRFVLEAYSPLCDAESTDATLKAVAREREARQIETMLIAQCCWGEQVSRRHSEAAELVKQENRAMLAAGPTRQQGLDRFVGAYGARVLAEPPDQGFVRLLYHAPWMVGLVSLVGPGFFIRHATWPRRGNASATVPQEPEAARSPRPPADGSATDEACNQRLDNERRDLE
jgi:cytochrome c-type biogenesis protein CcmH/NrfF